MSVRDGWVTTVCDRCYDGCGIRVQVVDEVVVGVEGDPDNPFNKGRMCGKGKAGVMAHYNPNRLKTPLKRTNPEKGIGVDPGWQEISYDEAIDTIVDRLRRIQSEPHKLHVFCWGYDCELRRLGLAFGTPHVQYTAAHECGKSVHAIEHMAAGGFHQQPDLHFCNYCIYVGTQGAVASRGSFIHSIREFADARVRGMRLIVVDPVGGPAAAKADEWVPIRPGTDAAFGLALINQLLNELWIYDVDFLKKGSNGPYLVGEDGRYVREGVSGKPLIFDPVDGLAKAYDDATIKDLALEGTFEVGGRRATPSFDLLRKHVAKYTPGFASEITTVPASTIVRLAAELGRAVQIGSTIAIEGTQFPFRPAVLDWARGPQGHKHGFHHSWALKLVNILLGNINVPGGMMSTGTMGKKPYAWGPRGGIDGMLTHAGTPGNPHSQTRSAFPGKKPGRPTRMDAIDLFPLASHTSALYPLVGVAPERFGLDFRIEVAMHNPANPILTCYADLALAEKFYKSIPFVFGYAFELNETNEAFDDVVLPVPTYLERQDAGTGEAFEGAYRPLSFVGMDDWYYQLRQRVFEPPNGMMHPTEVAMEIANRLGFLKDLNKVLNQSMRFKDEYYLQTDRKHNLDEFHDRLLKSLFGPERGVEWARQNGVVRFRRDAEEAYPGPYMLANGIRLPIYLEHFPAKGEELRPVIEEMGLEWDFSDYKALPEWMPCDAFEKRGQNGYEFIAVHYKVGFVYGAYGNENPWINEICERTPYTYPVLINEDIGKRKGIRDGDQVWLETPVRKVKATAKLTQCVHPEVVGIAGHFGHWARGMPISRDKGVAYNPLLPHDLDHLDKITTAIDNCALVRITKVEKTK
ncbi:MAG: molybdopterin-dependent oxidoreductase [Chloroflexi bacterium]|nr:molybdopterin-dependent oxidoreductase [Chloroflexota bacterium]